MGSSRRPEQRLCRRAANHRHSTSGKRRRRSDQSAEESIESAGQARGPAFRMGVAGEAPQRAGELESRPRQLVFVLRRVQHPSQSQLFQTAETLDALSPGPGFRECRQQHARQHHRSALRAFRQPPLRSGLLQAHRSEGVHLCPHTVHDCTQRRSQNRSTDLKRSPHRNPRKREQLPGGSVPSPMRARRHRRYHVWGAIGNERQPFRCVILAHEFAVMLRASVEPCHQARGFEGSQRGSKVIRSGPTRVTLDQAPSRRRVLAAYLSILQVT
jgi:hypothetical protein